MYTILFTKMLFNYKLVTKGSVPSESIIYPTSSQNTTFPQNINSVVSDSNTADVSTSVVSTSDLVDVDTSVGFDSDLVDIDTSVGLESDLVDMDTSVDSESSAFPDLVGEETLTTPSQSSDVASGSESSFPELAEAPNSYDIIDQSVLESYLTQPLAEIVDVLLGGVEVAAVAIGTEIFTIDPGMVVSSAIASLL